MDLNHRHLPYKGSALTTELHAPNYENILAKNYNFINIYQAIT